MRFFILIIIFHFFSGFFSYFFLCVSSFYFFSFSPLSLVFTLNCFTKLHIHVILSHDALVVNKYFWGILQNWKNICFFRFFVFCSYLQMKGIFFFFIWMKGHCMACCNLQCCFLVLYMAFLFLLAFFLHLVKANLMIYCMKRCEIRLNPSVSLGYMGFRYLVSWR